MLHGWKDVAEEELQPFNQCSGELSVMDGYLLWGGRVVVEPKPGQKLVLKEFYQGHPGTSRMKVLLVQMCVAKDQCRPRGRTTTIQPM